MLENYVLADRFLIAMQTDCESATKYLWEKADEFARLTIRFVPQVTEGEPALRFVYQDTTPMEVNFDSKKREMRLCCPWRQIDESTILPMMFRLMVEWLRQNEREIKLHASAVERGGTVALFLAPSEGGKTTTALAMCQQHRCLLRSNDAAVVHFSGETPLLLRGDTVFKVRHNGLEAYSKQLFVQKVSQNDTSNTPWYSKLRLSSDEMGIATTDNATPVRLVFFIRLDPLVEGLRITEYSGLAEERRQLWFKPNMMILQNISGTIRGVDLIPIGNEGTLLPLELPSLDTKEFSDYRKDFVNRLFSYCRVFQLRGQLAPITEFIDQALVQVEKEVM